MNIGDGKKKTINDISNDTRRKQGKNVERGKPYRKSLKEMKKDRKNIK